MPDQPFSRILCECLASIRDPRPGRRVQSRCPLKGRHSGYGVGGAGLGFLVHRHGLDSQEIWSRSPPRRWMAIRKLDFLAACCTPKILQHAQRAADGPSIGAKNAGLRVKGFHSNCVLEKWIQLTVISREILLIFSFLAIVSENRKFSRLIGLRRRAGLLQSFCETMNARALFQQLLIFFEHIVGVTGNAHGCCQFRTCPNRQPLLLGNMPTTLFKHRMHSQTVILCLLQVALLMIDLIL